MGAEIERKWLVDPSCIPYDLDKLQSYEIEQAYISFHNPTVRVRRINGGEAHILTIKTKPNADYYSAHSSELVREETEVSLSSDEYENLKGLCCGIVIIKRRYLHPVSDGLTEEIDIFDYDYKGLALLEIEFPDEVSAAVYPTPDWVIKDVTYDPRYKNASLASHSIPVIEF